MPLDQYGSYQAGSTSAPGYGPEETALVEGILAGFARARVRRQGFEPGWQEACQMAWPEHANTVFYGGSQTPGTKRTQQQLDSSVSIASHRFAALINSLWTPSSSVWHRFYHPDDYVMRQRDVGQYYDELTKTVWRERYRATAAFAGENMRNCQSLGVLGNMNMYVDEINQVENPGLRGLRYTSVPVGHIWYEISHQGQVCGFYRCFRWTAQQHMEKWPETFPPTLKNALEKQSKETFEVVQYVCRRTDWVPWRLDAKGKPYASYYVSTPGRCLLQEEGYRTFPLAVGRYMMTPDEDNGRGPMQMVLAAAKTLNAQKAVFLTQGHRAASPIYLTTESATFEIDRNPDAVNKGGLSDEGRKLIDVLPTGNIQITLEMMQQENLIINDAFLVSLFQLALKTADQPNLSARQVVEMIEERAMFLAPVTDGPHAEYLGGLIPRELDVLSWQGLLPEMPPVLEEAGAEYEVEFTNPMTRAMRAGETAAAMQMIEMTAEVARSTGDSSVWRVYNFPRMTAGMARNRGVNPDWMSTPQEIARAERAAAQQAAREQQAKEMPARAAIIKAQAIQSKAQAGQNIGGTLSGVPAEQMPFIPGNMPGREGVPGVGGRPGTTGIPAPR